MRRAEKEEMRMGVQGPRQGSSRACTSQSGPRARNRQCECLELNEAPGGSESALSEQD